MPMNRIANSVLRPVSGECTSHGNLRLRSDCRLEKGLLFIHHEAIDTISMCHGTKRCHRTRYWRLLSLRGHFTDSGTNTLTRCGCTVYSRIITDAKCIHATSADSGSWYLGKFGTITANTAMTENLHFAARTSNDSNA